MALQSVLGNVTEVGAQGVWNYRDHDAFVLPDRANEALLKRVSPDVLSGLMESNSVMTDLEVVFLSHDKPAPLDLSSLPQEIQKKYEPFQALPKSRAEWMANNQQAGGWNGINYRLSKLIHGLNNGTKETTLVLEETPNKLLQACIDARQELDTVTSWGSCQLHVSVQAPVIIEDRLGFVGQFRGAWTDRGGTYHLKLIAGGVDENAFGSDISPLVKAVRLERLEEFWSEQTWRLSRPLYILHEEGIPPHSGNGNLATYCNVAHTVSHPDGAPIEWNEYLEMFNLYSEKLQKEGTHPDKAEVKGWGVFFVDETPMSKGPNGELLVHNLQLFRPTADGKIESFKQDSIGAFSWGAYAELLQFMDPESPMRKMLLREAGISGY